MRFTSQTTADGVSEHLFILGDIHGVLWAPADASGSRPLVLLGHGGGQHKKAPGILARARRFVISCGFAAAAIDAPGHGDRPKTEQDEQHVAGMRQRLAAGEPAGPLIERYNWEISARAVPEWRAVLDALQDAGHAGGPVGFWGVSMASAIGIPFVAADARIAVAGFGLVGHETLAAAAAQITVPVEFAMQWDDEVFPRDSCFALFDAFASQEKTLRANPGLHQALPRFEVDSSELFFRRHLAPH
jgi:pimeloyl-ACP methyl ester carboxylesterase